MALGLIIDGQSFDIEGAWKHNRSLRRARSTIVMRSASVAKPYVDGRTGFPARVDEIMPDLELMVKGETNGAGVPYADRLAGLDENLAYLEDWVLAHADGMTASWPATLETASGRTFTAGVQILNWQILQENVTQVVIGYDLRVSAGRWTEVV